MTEEAYIEQTVKVYHTETIKVTLKEALETHLKDARIFDSELDLYATDPDAPSRLVRIGTISKSKFTNEEWKALVSFIEDTNHKSLIEALCSKKPGLVSLSVPMLSKRESV